MKTHTRLASLALAVFFAALTGACSQDMQGMHDMHGAMWDKVNHAVAVLEPTQGNSTAGVIYFDQDGQNVHIHGDVRNLPPNTTHGFHIHEYGDDTSANGSSAGGHYNPQGHPHGGPNSAMHHAGDLGNIAADASGVAHVDETVNDISIAGMKNPIVGRGLVVHGGPDDLTSQPSGNAGPRLAVGVIGIAK